MIARSAQKALSLKKDIIFRLMLVMMVLLGWLAGVGAGGIIGLENLYSKWQLEQRSKVNIYLMAESSEEQVDKMLRELRSVQGVEKVDRLTRVQTLGLLEPYFDGSSNFPLPVVVDVVVDDSVKRQSLDERVLKYFPTAEIDDARYLLESVGRGVRLAQMITLLFAGILFIIMSLLVSLTVRAGLRGQKHSLSVLQYVGATDAFVVTLVTRQVLRQSLFGWLVAVTLAALSIMAAIKWNAGLNEYLSWNVWVGAVVTPLLLAMIAVALTWVTTRKVIQET